MHMRIIIFSLFFVFFFQNGFGQSNLDSLTIVSPLGHTSWVSCSKLRNNILYTGSHDKTIKLWDFKSQKELKTFSTSKSIIYDLDVTKNGEYIVSTHQNNYITIQNIHDVNSIKTIQFSQHQLCESAFFLSNDSLIIVTIFDSLKSTIIKVIDFYTLKVINEYKTPFLNDNLIYSQDRKYWFFSTDSKTLYWNSYVKGKIITNELKTDFEIENFVYDNIFGELTVFGKSSIVKYDIYGTQKSLLQNIELDKDSPSIEFVIPLINEKQLLIANNKIFLHDIKFKNISKIDSFKSQIFNFYQNIKDSSILISSDFLFRYFPNTRRFDTLFQINEKESINFNCSDNYFSIEGEAIRLVSNNEPKTNTIRFNAEGKEKFDLQVSSNGKNIVIQNGIDELEIFCINDFRNYKQLVVNFNIIDFDISNNGNVYVLNDANKLNVYFLNGNRYVNSKLNIQYDVSEFSIQDSINQIWIITTDNKLVKLNSNNLNLVANLNLPKSKQELTIYSANFKSYLKVISDNYNYCNLYFAEVGKVSTNKKFHCSTGVSEGLFTYGLSEDGKYVSLINETNSFLLIYDVSSQILVKKIDISTFDEIIDVSISNKLDLVCFSTLDDSIYCYSLKNPYTFKPLRDKYKEVRDIKIDETNNMLLLSSSDGNFYLFSLSKFEPIYSMYSLKKGGYFVKLYNAPFYMCSKNASRMLHYVTPSLRIIGFEQLEPVYNRPEIVLETIGSYFGVFDKQLVNMYRHAWEKRILKLGLDKQMLINQEISIPVVNILEENSIPYLNYSGKINLSIFANDSKYKLKRFNVFVNEVPLFSSFGIILSDNKIHAFDTSITIPLSVGENKIQISVLNEIGLENFKYPTYVNYTPTSQIIPQTLFIGIGVNIFKNESYNLNFCVKDVNDLASSFAGKNTEVVLLTNEQVNRENLLKLKNYLNKTTVNDQVIISCSSHGLLDDSLNFYLATHDVDFKHPESRGFKYEDLESLLDGIYARKKLLFLDACNSGENDKTQLLKMELQMNKTKIDTSEFIIARGEIIQKEDTNVENFRKMNELFVNVRNNTGSVIISAAGGQENALEAIEVDGKIIANGAFTYCVLEYLNLNKNKKEMLTVNKLKNYVEARVEDITNGKQKPTSRQETLEIDWYLK